MIQAFKLFLFIMAVIIMIVPVANAATHMHPIEGAALAADVNRPVILLLEKDGSKMGVVAAVFPDSRCVRFPSRSILLLPHKYRLAPNGYIPCGKLN